MELYDGVDRRKEVHLTSHQIDVIAERAAEKAIEKVYSEVGKSVAHKLFWILGAGVLGLFAWLNGQGWIK